MFRLSQCRSAYLTSFLAIWQILARQARLDRNSKGSWHVHTGVQGFKELQQPETLQMRPEEHDAQAKNH